jgi:hypothetical protein
MLFLFILSCVFVSMMIRNKLQKNAVNLSKETTEVLHLDCSIMWCWRLGNT